MGEPRRDSIAALNGLRALACLAVFGVHWQQFTAFAASWGPFDAKRFLEEGHTGVALFFMLSGCLLSIPFWDGRISRGDRWIGGYVRSRAVRILPAYYLCLAYLVITTAHFRSVDQRLDTTLHVVMLHSLREQSFYSLAPPFWTLGVQALSYVWMPVVLFAISRFSSAWQTRAALLAALTIAVYVLHWETFQLAPGSAIADWIRREPTVATHSVLAHVPHFLLGMLAGLAFARRNMSDAVAVTPSILRELSVWLAGLAVLVVLSTTVGDWLSVPYGRYHFPFVPLLLMWIILEAPRTSAARRFLEAWPLRRLGIISFGVYVYHYPAMDFSQTLLHRFGLSVSRNWAVFGLVSLALSIAVAAVSYLLIESPLVRLSRPRQRTRPAEAMAVAV
jgi:peptidoglycan/LPS O-acetylase OafA/YrhL